MCLPLSYEHKLMYIYQQQIHQNAITLWSTAILWKRMEHNRHKMISQVELTDLIQKGLRAYNYEGMWDIKDIKRALLFVWILNF